MADIIGATTNLISTAQSLGSSFGLIPPGVNVPAPNILSNYASYNYVISLSALTTQEFNFPDESYKKGKVLPIICKTAGADPNNRVQTNYGKHEFYINNLTFESLIGLQTSKATNVSTVQFDVYEPYSIGLFMLALQTAAANAKHKNWRDAPFLLSIEFRGNRETGAISKVPFSTRHIPIRLTTVNMTSNEQGTRYLINAFATQGLALTTEFANLRTDTIIKGKTIREVLQTGEQSLQTVVNEKLQELVTKKDVAVADQIVILFPKEEDMASAKAAAAQGAPESKTNKAYVNPQQSSASTEILDKIGVSASSLQQSISSVNKIGLQTMGFDQERRGEIPAGNQADTWDPVTRTWLRGKLIADIAEGTFKFSQDMDIPTVINQIILASSYADAALAPEAAENGMVPWWRIDTQIYYVETDANETTSGKKPKIAVYRVVPFRAHLSKAAGANASIPGFDQLKSQVVKRYDYLFTGKNTEVLKFNIDFSVGFANVLAADSYTNTQGVVEAAATSKVKQEGVAFQVDASPPGQKAPTIPGQNPTQTNQSGTSNSTDFKGGGGTETATQRVAKTFHDAITNPYDMIVLDLEIVGDPYWIINSGMGNFNATQVQGVKDLNRDGSVSWQTSQVDIIVNFRSPIDINQVTGMYDFKSANHQDMTKDPKAGPAIGFTGLYCVNRVKSEFRNGEFRQTLAGFRRNGQEYKDKGSGKNAINSKTPAEK